MDDNVAFAQSIKNVSIKHKSLSALTSIYVLSILCGIYFIEKTAIPRAYRLFLISYSILKINLISILDRLKNMFLIIEQIITNFIYYFLYFLLHIYFSK